MIRSILVASAAIACPAFAAGPLEVTSQLLTEHRTPAADGTTRVRMVPATRAVPGDRLTVAVAYRNTGRAPIADLAIVNPVPGGLSYGGPAAGSPAPEVSADGVRFAALAALTVAGRAATASEITHVRWRLTTPLAAGSGGRFAFQAVLK